MTANEFNLICRYLLNLASCCSSGTFGNEKTPTKMRMGGTPLNETIITAIDIVNLMRKETKAQFVNVIFLTDGEATTRGHFVSDSGASVPINYVKERVFLHDGVTKKDYLLEDKDITETNQFLRLLRDRTKTNVIGFYVCPKLKELEVFQKFISKEERKKRNLNKELEDNRFVVALDTGYTEFYIIPGGEFLRIRDSKGINGFTNDQLVASMTSNGIEQRKQRILLSRFVKLIT